MAARRPPVCKRPGCEAPRKRTQLVCGRCWSDIPHAERKRYLKAYRAHMRDIAATIGREILGAIGRKPAQAAPTVPPEQAYRRTCAMLGEAAE